MNIKLGKGVGPDTECYVACKNGIVLHLSSGVGSCTLFHTYLLSVTSPLCSMYK